MAHAAGDVRARLRRRLGPGGNQNAFKTHISLCAARRERVFLNISAVMLCVYSSRQGEPTPPPPKCWRNSRWFFAQVWDHATLLCSLLLGYGLDARVCVGTMSDGRGGAQPHVWVATWSRPPPDRHGVATIRVRAWESATGRTCSLAPLDAEARAKYLSVACVFAHDSFHANAQPSDALLSGSLDVDDASCWLALDGRRVEALTHAAAPSATADFGLARPRVDASAAAAAVEAELRTLVAAYRRDARGLATSWDDDLSYMLQPALAAYEQERVVGHAASHDDFQDAIRRRVPHGHCFKGFPTCFPHLNAQRMLAALQRGDLSADVIDTEGHHVTHALRVRVFPYAEDVAAVWVMMAVHYEKPV